MCSAVPREVNLINRLGIRRTRRETEVEKIVRLIDQENIVFLSMKGIDAAIFFGSCFYLLKRHSFHYLKTQYYSQTEYFPLVFRSSIPADVQKLVQVTRCVQITIQTNVTITSLVKTTSLRNVNNNQQIEQRYF